MKKNIKCAYIRTTLVLCLTCVCCYAYSQPNTPKEVPSPNASDLGRYGDIDVSYSNGTINPAIPLFECEQNGVKLNISLSYESSGVRVNNLPGWTGHNWSLNAGGAITRTVNGRADELKKPTFYDTVNRRWLPYFEVYNTYYNAGANYYNQCDVEADLFHFNFMGKTGTFMFGQDGQWHVKSDSNIDVIFDINNEDNYVAPFIDKYPMSAANGPWQPKTIKGFILVDDDGVRYHFGYLGNDYPDYPNGKTNAIEYSMSMSSMAHDSKHADWIACTWYLTKVEDRFGNLLYSFVYERDYYIINFFNNLSIFDSNTVEWEALSIEQQEALRGGCRLDTSPIIHDDRNLIDYTFSTDYRNDYFPYSGSVIAPVYLKNISTWDGVNIDFTRIDLDIPTDTLYASLYKNNNRPSLSAAYQDCYYLQNIAYKAYQKNKEKVDLYNVDPLKAMGLKLLSSIHVYSLDEDSTTYKEGLSINLGYDTTGKVHLTDISFSTYDFDSFFESWLDDSWPSKWSETAFNKNYIWENKPSVMKYTLRYNDFDKLPSDYLTTATDAWGYYNGKGYNSSYVHDLGLGRNWENYAQKKTVNTQTSLYGSLKEIVYPTGGKTVFEFENNDYSLCLDSTRQELTAKSGICGGLRIKRISNIEANGDTLSDRRFIYTIPDSNVSSGQLVSFPKYTNFYRTSGGYYSRLLQSQSLLPLVNSHGCHISYPYVKEVYANGTSVLYNFSSYSDVKDDIPLMFLGYNTFNMVCINNRDYMRGKLIKSEFFDENSQLVKVDTFSYERSSSELSSMARYNKLSILGMGYILGGSASFYHPKYNLVHKVSTIYNNGIPLYSDEYQYSYTEQILTLNTGGYNHMGRICKLASEVMLRDSCSISTTYSYPFNMISFPFSNELSGMAYCNPIIEKKNYRNNILVDRNFTEYGIFPNGLICPTYNKRETNSSISIESSYLDYDARGWLTQYRDKASNVQIIWDSWNSRNKIEALVKGNAIAEPVSDFDTYETFNTDNITNYQELRNSNPSSLITSYTYTPLGKIHSITSPNGWTLFYSYDGMGHLTSIKDANGKIIKTFEYNYFYK